MSIQSAMKRRGLTTSQTATKSGVEAAHLSAYKRGSRTMGRKAATKLAPHLGESPEELMISNRGAVLKRAEGRGDVQGVLNAAKGLVQIAEDAGAGGAELDGLVDHVLKFAQTHGTASGYGSSEGFEVPTTKGGTPSLGPSRPALRGDVRLRGRERR